MFLDTVDQFAKTAVAKSAFLRNSPLGFTISSMMAGCYVGLGIILIFCVGNAVDPSIRPIVMGASFGIALTLVIFAGSDLFTGHTMFMTHGWLQGRITLRELGAAWGMSWAGNLVGCALLAMLFVAGGGGPALLGLGGKAPLIVSVASAKMNAPALELVARAILCNWLVCLAIWMAARTDSDAAKLGLIFWPVFAFVASGFEHSVANMFVFALALISEHPANITFAGAVHNELSVTLGNLAGGGIFMGLGYWLQEGGIGHPSNARIPATGNRARTN
jgi:nitrite transporter NirC